MKGLEAAKSGTDTENPGLQKVLSYLQIVYDVKHQTDPQTCAGLLESHNLTKEFIPSPLYKSVEVCPPKLYFRNFLAQRPLLSLPLFFFFFSLFLFLILSCVLLKCKDFVKFLLYCHSFLLFTGLDCSSAYYAFERSS